MQALIEAVRGRYEIARRWYRLKARLLGVERLADYDRMAAVTEDEVSYPFAQAREIVLDCYSSFSPELGALAGRFFDERRIDAPVRPGKRGGAFCASAVPVGAPVRAAQLHLPPARRARRSRTSSATACTSRSPPARASSTRARR